MSESDLPTLTIEVAKTKSDLESVREIYRGQKATLGFLPKGAFDERFQKKQIYVSKLDDEIVGYLLFTVNQKREVRIAHLAVAKTHQRKGVASLLVKKLKTDYADYSRIRLQCRSDYAAAKVWFRLGFVACRRLPGKADGSELIVFQYRLNDTPLFDQLEDDSDLPIVVCDANVCMDIEYSTRDRHEAASGLLADWLVNEIDLRVTPEILNDFDRQPEPVRSRMMSVIRSKWHQVVADQTDVENSRQIIRSVLGDPKDDSAASDEKHLAIAAAARVSAFATYDGKLLENAPEILSRTGLRVQKPSGIIVDIDSVLRSHYYQYRELRNSGINRMRVRSVDEVEIKRFFKTSDGESQRIFRSYLDGVLSVPDKWDLYQIKSDDGQSLALFSVKKEKSGVHIVERIRVANKIDRTLLGRTLIDYVAHQPLGAWNSGELRIVRIADPNLCRELASAFLNRGFAFHDQELWRLSLPGCWDKDKLIRELELLAGNGLLPSVIANQLKMLAEESDSPKGEVTAKRLEHLIHPGKLSFGNLPNYVIPIQPEWAQELFDFRIWRHKLFSPETKLVINPDSVYYKKPKNSPRTDYGRILWYVSGDAERGGKSIRACSALTRRVPGSVKDLFREFQRMGVFEWPQLMNHFGNADADALAIEFTDTELLDNPLRFEQVNDILEKHNLRRQQFISSVEIPAAAFQEIYKYATNRS